MNDSQNVLRKSLPRGNGRLTYMAGEGDRGRHWGANSPNAYLRHQATTSLVTQQCRTDGSDNHSDIDHTWSANPAAIAGLRSTRRPSSSLQASVRTGQRKL